MNKTGVSEIVSYVLLISIVIGISIGVYAWMKVYAVNPNTVDCKEGTSITLQDYECSTSPSPSITLTIRNNGRFNITGVIVAVANSSKREPEHYLNLSDSSTWSYLQAGYAFFSNPLRPGEEQTVEFSNKIKTGTIKSITSIKIQPFIIDTRNNRIFKILCSKSIISQKINNCIFIT